ncbi:MAG: S8 family serine peptidase [Actinomycetota bacterium]
MQEQPASVFVSRLRTVAARHHDIEVTDGWLHRPGQLLVSSDAHDDVASALSRLKMPVGSESGQAGTVSIALPHGVGVHEVVARLEDALGYAGRFGPNHVFVAAPWLPWGPGGEPRELSALSWSMSDSSDGEGVQVGIVDTGLLPEFREQAWLGDVHADPDDFETKDVDENGYLDPIVGHGTFIAGVVRRWAPRASITIDKALSVDGLCDEITLAAAIDQALDRNPDILSLSLGAYTRGDQPPIGLEAAWKRIKEQQPHCVVVSAAGNDGINRQFWPAATETVIGVGAVDSNKNRADFSNHGPWVDVWAEGVDIESAFADGSYLPADSSGPRSFSGICQWSGTSFATPLAGAAIASRMSRDAVSAPQAYARVHADAQQVAGVGRVVSMQPESAPAY